jgi:hypothetical protein
VILGLALESYGNSREALAEMRRAESLFRSAQDRRRVRAADRVDAPLRARFAARDVRGRQPGSPGAAR